MVATRDILVPHFTYGTYQAEDGSAVKFTDDLLRKLERNTNFVIAQKILTPPVTYDAIDENGRYLHNSAKSTDAHGAVTRAVFKDGVLHLGIDPSQTLREDVKDKKRLRVSGVFHPNYWYNDEAGKKIEIGPTVIATTMLGARRPAMRNPKIVPLSELQFSEDTTPVDAWAAREELRRSGFVAQTLAGDSYAFSEIDIDPKAFGEPERQEQTMTDAEIQAAIANGIKAATQPLVEANAKLQEQVKSFSETTKREAAAHSFCEKLTDDRKKTAPLPKLFMEKLEDLLIDPEATAGIVTKVKALAESAPGAYVAAPKTGDDKGKGKGKADDEDADEPPALVALRPKHFADITANEQMIADGLAAFSEFQPDAVKGLENNPAAQLDKLRRYVTTRDTAN